MPALQYGLSSYERAEGGLPELPVINMYGEQTGSEGISLQSRPALADRLLDMGAGPVGALYRRDGVISGELLGHSNGRLYRNTTLVGTVVGGGHPSIAGNETGVMVTAGATLYSYDGTTFAAVSFPDSADVVKVVEGASRFIALRKNTGKFYFTPPLAQTFDALDFATAESESDRLLDALFIDDVLVLFGSETVEFWPNTGSSTLPFQPLQGRVFKRGIKATGCVSPLGSTFFWVTDQNEVCLQDENNVISNAGLQARIAASTAVSVFRFFIDGVEFGAVRLDNETQVFNPRSGLWSEFASNGQANWVPQCFADGVFGSSIDGRTFQWGAGRADLGGVMERRFRAGAPINGGGLPISNIVLRCNPGNTGALTGVYADPTIEMRLSRNAGRTWGDWKQRSLGVQGEYRERVIWRGFGLASQPGLMVEFRVTDPVDFRVSGVFYNEPYGGR